MRVRAGTSNSAWSDLSGRDGTRGVSLVKKMISLLEMKLFTYEGKQINTKEKNRRRGHK
jgi:hypothetical protein